MSFTHFKFSFTFDKSSHHHADLMSYVQLIADQDEIIIIKTLFTYVSYSKDKTKDTYQKVGVILTMLL